VTAPAGNGPFAVVIYNHGSEPTPAPCGPPALAAFYREHGYAFFAFQRHGHAPSPGEYIVDLQKGKTRKDVIQLHELYNLDVVATVDWVKHQKWADPQRIVMTGISYGGIQTLLTAEKGLGIRAFLPFAPAAMSWNPVLAERLKTAVKGARAPVFLVQAENDYSIEPSRVLGAELTAPSAAKVYPAFGTTHQDGHSFGARAKGIAVWSGDVLMFLQRVGVTSGS